MPASSARLQAAALCGYVCVAVLFSWPLPLHLTDALLGGPSGDTGVYVWNLWLFRHEIVAHHTFPFFTPEILSLMPPVPLALHNYTTFANIVAFPLLPVLGTVATFNVLTIGSAVVTAHAMFVLARFRTGDPGAAWIGGLLFGFSPFIMARSTGHFSLVMAAPLPLFSWAMYRVTERPTLRRAAVAGAIVAWAYLCDPYYAVFCILMACFSYAYSVLWLERRPSPDVPGSPLRWTTFIDLTLLCLAGFMVGVLLRGGGRVDMFGVRVSMRHLYTPMLVFVVVAHVRVFTLVRLRRVRLAAPLLSVLRMTGTGAAVCAIVLAPILYPMASSFGEQQWISPKVWWRSSAPGIDLLAWVIPNPLHPVLGGWGSSWLRTLPNGLVENTASIPWVAAAVILLAMVVARFRPPFAWVLFTAFFGLLALGPFVRVAGHTTYVPTPWVLLRYLPVVGAARMPTRLSVLVMLGVAMLVAMAVRELRVRAARPWVPATVVGLLLCFELLPAPRRVYSAYVPEFYKIIAADPRPVRVLTLPLALGDGLSSRGEHSAAAQFYQTVHEKPLVGGYMSRLPRRHVRGYRGMKVIRTLMDLSEGRRINPARLESFIERAHSVLPQQRIGYVVIDTTRASPQLIAFARAAYDLELVATDGPQHLYRTELASPTPAR